ncbi:MAG: alpha/beta hydrolase family protein [Polyangiaceae bacterium]
MIHPLDHLFARHAARRRMFTEGWGDTSALDGFHPEAIAPESIGAPTIRFGAPRPHPTDRAQLVRDGWFESPAPNLPSELRAAHVRLLRRPGNDAVCVVFAGSRDEGYALRASLFGPLTHAAVDLLLLENPYYGRRRALGARDANVATVADQARMNIAALFEAIALLRWAERAGYTRLGVAGYSMGGYLAALAGALERRPIAVAALAAGADPAPVYTRGLLSKSVDFTALARDDGDERAARERLRALFTRADLTALPRPAAPHATVVVGMAGDGYVPPEETARLARYWLDAPPITLPSGHVAGVFTERAGLRKAIARAFEALTSRRA